jgi:hypothetical protein
MGSQINDVVVGQDTRIDICSYSHGRKRVPMAQTLAFTPKKTVNAVGEFDNRSPVLTWEVMDGVDVTLDAVQADQTDLDAMIMDNDPNAPINGVDESNGATVRIWCNYKGRNTGYLTAGDWAEGLRVSANPTTASIKDPTKKNYTFVGTRHVKVSGKTGQKCSIQYNRFVNTPAYATTDDIAFVGSVGTFPKKPVQFPIGLGVLVKSLNVVKNGTALTETTDYAIDTNAGTITMVVAPIAGDVVETWTVTQG